MTFDLIKIIFMLISILLGNFVGIYISAFIGMWGAVVGAIIIGMVIYFVYSLLSGQKPFLMGSFVFGVLNYVSILVSGYIGTQTGIGGGLMAIFLQAIFLSLLWGWIGGKAQPQKTVESGINL